MPYYNDRDRFGGNNNRHRHPRINESDVPESKHTIFVRGLSGELSPEEVKDYIEDRIGRVTFDFVKITQDRSKLFVAVRFESREEAKEFMTEYTEREFMGYRCNLSWFRDIRRFCAYQQSKNPAPKRNSPRRRRRSDSEASKRSSPPPSARSKSRSKSRSRTRSRSSRRSVSRSPSSRGRSATPKRKENEKREERKRTRTPTIISDDSDDERRNKRKAKTWADEEESEYDNKRGKRNKRNGNATKISDASPISDRSRSKSPKRSPLTSLPSIPLPPRRPASPSNTLSSVFIPPPVSNPEDQLTIQKPLPVNKEIKINLKQDESPVLGAAARAVQNTRFSVGLEDEAPPKLIFKNEEINQFNPPVPPISKNANDSLPPPPVPPPFTIKSENFQSRFYPIDVERKPEWSVPMDMEIDDTSSAPPKNTENVWTNTILTNFEEKPKLVLPITEKLFGHLNEFQSKLLKSVVFEKKDEEENQSTFGGLKLSSMNNEESLEEEKALIRETKLANLSDEQMLRFTIRKKQFEAAYRGDCETYAIVTRSLLSKDESLLVGLKVALLENLEDLYKKMLQRVDDFLDTIA